MIDNKYWNRLEFYENVWQLSRSKSNKQEVTIDQLRDILQPMEDKRIQGNEVCETELSINLSLQQQLEKAEVELLNLKKQIENEISDNLKSVKAESIVKLSDFM